MTARDEFELKLALSRENLAALRHHALMQSAVRRVGTRSRLVTTYFDTPKLALKDRGLALRVRRDGDRHVQTLKAAQVEGPTVRRRREYEAEVPSNRPDLTLIDHKSIKRFLRRGKAPLQPVFTSEIERDEIPLRFAGSDIALAFDVGEIRSGDRVEDVCEAELELKSGSPAQLIELALALNEQVPLRVEGRTKADRGYRLSSGESALPVNAQPLAIPPAAGVGIAFEMIARASVEQVRANERAFLDSEPAEAVHQIRVGLRRFRAALSLFRKVMVPATRDYLRDELKWLQQSFGPARDLDVVIAGYLRPRRGRNAAAVAAVAGVAATLRAEAYDRGRAALSDPRYTRLLLNLELWFDNHEWLLPAARPDARRPEPIRTFARRTIAKWDAKIRTLVVDPAALSVEEQHDLRIRAKKLRYALEFTAGVFSKRRAHKLRTLLADLQDALGRTNDIATAGQVLDAIRTRGAASTEAMAGVRAVERRLAAVAAAAGADIDSLGRKILAAKSL
jgi:inorganic triphosphatase YgiF